MDKQYSLVKQKLTSFTHHPSFKFIGIFVVVVLLIFSVYFWVSLIKELSTGLGPFYGNHYDFLAFYGAASLTLHGHISQIFDASSLINIQRQIVTHPVGASGYMPYLNPPFTALLLSPLALFTIEKARLVWLIINAGLMICLAFWFAKPLGSKKLQILGAALLLGTYPVYQALIEGQLSIVILFGCVLAYLAAQKNQYILSGIFLSILFIKPQFAIFAIIGLIIARQWKVIASMLATISILLLVLLPLTGFSLYFTYVRFMLNVVTAHFNGAGAVVPTIWQGALNTAAGFNGFFTALFGQSQVLWVNIFTVIGAITLVVLFIFAVKKTGIGIKNKPKQLLLAAAIGAALLIDPHLYAQDVILLYITLPFLLGLNHYFRTIVFLVIICDIVKLDQAMRIHLFTIIIYALVAFVFVKAIRHNPKSIAK